MENKSATTRHESLFRQDLAPVAWTSMRFHRTTKATLVIDPTDESWTSPLNEPILKPAQRPKIDLSQLERHTASLSDGWRFVESGTVDVAVSKATERAKDCREYIDRVMISLSAFTKTHFNASIDKRFFGGLVTVTSEAVSNQAIKERFFTEFQNQFIMICSAHLTAAIAKS